MPPIPGADDTPSESATAPVFGSSPSEDPAMEVDEGAVGPPPTSPVTREDDNLLTDNDAVGVDVGIGPPHSLVPQWTRQGGRGSLRCSGASPSGGSFI